MLYKTHKAGGVLGMCIAFEVMKQKGLIIPNVNEFIQLMMMYPAVSWGSTFPDLDHNPDSVKEQTPFNMFINKLLRISGAKHRSWQTHSVAVTGGVLLVLYLLLSMGDYIVKKGSIEWIYLRLILMGVIVGVLSHLILDILTTAGVHLYPGFKIRLVPRISAFATGGLWENIIYWLIKLMIYFYVINKVLLSIGIDIGKLLKG